nr:hypothetical protein L203_06684 [Cryptococcus depauperatus CBS 7841]
MTACGICPKELHEEIDPLMKNLETILHQTEPGKVNLESAISTSETICRKLDAAMKNENLSEVFVVAKKSRRSREMMSVRSEVVLGLGLGVLGANSFPRNCRPRPLPYIFDALHPLSTFRSAHSTIPLHTPTVDNGVSTVSGPEESVEDGVYTQDEWCWDS